MGLAGITQKACPFVVFRRFNKLTFPNFPDFQAKGLSLCGPSVAITFRCKPSFHTTDLFPDSAKGLSFCGCGDWPSGVRL